MEKQSSADEFQVSVDKLSHLLKSQPPKLYLDSWRRRGRRRQIQKVPPQIRRRMRRNEVYDPVMVSLGPYHHGKAELRRSEEFKHLCLDWRGGGDEQKKALFYSKILSEIDAIRDSYAEVEVVEKYDDESLALMMLLDGSMIVDFMLNFIGVKESSLMSWQLCLGAGSWPLMIRDMMVMENQIPFRVVKMLISLQYEEEEEAASILPRFMSYKIGVELDHAAIPQEKEDPPIHFLEAYWRVLVKNRRRHTSPAGNSNGFMLSGLLQEREDQKHRDRYDVSYTPRSVMDLKAKGIRVRPNSTLLLRDIAFRPSNGCFSHLHLPLLLISDQASVIWANMIAYEVLPNRCTSLAYLSYAIFMKSLIQSPEDVKELQERGLMSNRTANLEKVVELFKEIDTFGLHEQDIFKDVKREIEEHCNSRAKTWLAELIYTRFRTPWTSIALFAAVLLLCLTFLQTFYTIRR